jgi:hypothetical protein
MLNTKDRLLGISFAVPVLKSAPETFYFCIPKNDQLLAYWDTVADRLFKIRHCMNIEGVERQLPLFEPPIDPALLVRAVAMGLDPSSVLSDINSPQPAYRLSYMLQKALELCGELKSLGGALLSALEKKDAEELAALRAGHETNLLQAIRDVKQRQVDEANSSQDALKQSWYVTEQRRNYYRDIVRINTNEQAHMDDLEVSLVFSQIAQGIGAAASAAHLVPDFHSGSSGAWSSPVVVASYGGSNVGSGIQAAATYIGTIAAQYTHAATMESIKGGYDRRWDDWKQQEKVANKELVQIEKQIAAAEIRVAIAENDLENQDKQIESSVVVEDFLRNKYTSQELYGWMTAQISKVYFQAYKLAYDLAKRAERAYRFERGLTSSNFIQFGYWDSLRKGLLAGEQLALDLKRMEAAYLDQNKREYEISKHISLMLLDPMALITLKETGRCEVALPEALFDTDYPGHYMRRIKSVSLTIPCVTGPYTSINCTLTLLTNKTRIGSNAQTVYEEQDEDPRFVTNFAAIQSIATSHAQNDSGMFELNFRDERYLPFEGAGADSRWRIELPKDCNAFDFETISDVVLNINYTARDGGRPLQDAAGKSLKAALSGADLPRMFSLKHEFPTEWYGFLHPAGSAENQTMTLGLTVERFPFRVRGKAAAINQIDLFMKFKDVSNQTDYNNGTLTAHFTPPGGSPVKTSSLNKEPGLPGLLHGKVQVSSGLGAWELQLTDADVQNVNASLRTSGSPYRLKPEVIDDIVMVCHYSA